MTKIITLASGHETIVDDDVYEWASQYKWHLGNKGYARRSEYTNRKQKWIYLHKVIIDCPDGMMRDHVNGNRLDNRHSNLRIVTNQQNTQNRKTPKHNTTGYKGVSFEKGKYWRAFIGINGKKKAIGYFRSAEDAARAYDEAAKKYYGKYAKLNFDK